MKSVKLPSIVGAANAGATLVSATAPVHSARARTGTRTNMWIVRVSLFIWGQPLCGRSANAERGAAAHQRSGAVERAVQGAAVLLMGRGAETRLGLVRGSYGAAVLRAL